MVKNDKNEVSKIEIPNVRGPENRLIGKVKCIYLHYIENCIAHEEESKCLVSRDIWHQRFGHVSMKYIEIMNKNELVKGFCPMMNCQLYLLKDTSIDWTLYATVPIGFGLLKLKNKSESKDWIVFIFKRLRNTLVEIRVDGAKKFICNLHLRLLILTCMKKMARLKECIYLT
jgi:hypothetical protein